MDDPVAEKKRRRNERRRQRYADDPEYREESKARSRASARKNKDAINAALRERYAADPEFRACKRKSKLKTNYGMSLEEYAAKLAEQGDVCIICLRPKGKKRLCVDHNHKTRKLRSLLCDRCNRGLGYFDEQSATLRRAVDYLDYWEWRHANPDDTGPPPFALSGLHRLFDPSHPSMSLPSIQSPPLAAEDMTPTDEPTEGNKASRTHVPLASEGPAPADRLQVVVHAIVDKASQGTDGGTSSLPTKSRRRMTPTS